MPSIETHPEAFFLFAETFFPDAESRAANLNALALCAEGTARLTPSVATYVFRNSALSEAAGPPQFTGAAALESTELYLTHQGFRDHLTTEEFRTGLRTMYRDIKRLGARIYWIGPRPPSDILHNIYRSDPLSRPVATLTAKLFDASVYASAPAEHHVIISLLCRLGPGGGAQAADALDALNERLRTVSLVGFFHPESAQTLRVFFVAPIDDGQSATRIAEALAPFDAFAKAEPEPSFASAHVHASRADVAAAFRAATSRSAFAWDVQAGGHSGHILHPNAPTGA